MLRLILLSSESYDAQSLFFRFFFRVWTLKILFVSVSFVAMFLTLLQYPLHLYMIIQLRKANPHNAGNGGSEDKWDFGQVAALVLILPVIKECIEGYLTMED